jgi:hypothetical protein
MFSYYKGTKCYLLFQTFESQRRQIPKHSANTLNQMFSLLVVWTISFCQQVGQIKQLNKAAKRRNKRINRLSNHGY